MPKVPVPARALKHSRRRFRSAEPYRVTACRRGDRASSNVVLLCLGGPLLDAAAEGAHTFLIGFRAC